LSDVTLLSEQIVLLFLHEPKDEASIFALI
jgi:hypothetical protein